MRISDWSSDVCSSDLGQADVAGHHRAVFDGFTDELAKGVVDLALERAELAATGLHQFMLFGENNATPERSHVDFKIGRASCRERVCQCVYMSVVAVS